MLSILAKCLMNGCWKTRRYSNLAQFQNEVIPEPVTISKSTKMFPSTQQHNVKVIKKFSVSCRKSFIPKWISVHETCMRNIYFQESSQNIRIAFTRFITVVPVWRKVFNLTVFGHQWEQKVPKNVYISGIFHEWKRTILLGQRTGKK